VDEEHVTPVGAQALQARVDFAQDVWRGWRRGAAPGWPAGGTVHGRTWDEDDVAAVPLERGEATTSSEWPAP